MNAASLRDKHPRFIYKSYSVSSGNIQFNFLLEPDITFTSVVTIPIPQHPQIPELFIFNLGIVEAISYWKAACPKEFIIEAGALTKEQIAWWHDLFINGLGEFFYKNNIDFTEPGFLTITTTGQELPTLKESTGSGDLIMVGGGKDSVVTLGLLKNQEKNNVLLLNPTPAALAVTKVARFHKPIIVKRTIDAKLLELNKQGYLNGHTPFSAYLAFLGVLVAKIYGFNHVIASNEESASFGNVMFRGQEINHQYSKSYRFEKMFREYVKNPNYFSFLRPLNELDIAYLFSKMTKYHGVFKSCNVGKGQFWCGSCPKCAFTYVVLSAFLSLDSMQKIFGADFFTKPQLRQHFLDLSGLGDKKPFECVGTPQETKQALSLTIAKYQTLPPILAELKEKLGIADAVPFLPKAYEQILRN